MIVILEGPDGAGKTTLARQLQETFKLEYHHEGPPPPGEHPLWYYGRTLASFRGRRIVLDRFALGERVYGPSLRGVDRLGAEGWQVFSRLTAALSAIQIIVLPPPQLCEERWRNSPKAELFDDVLLLYRTYAEFAYLATTDFAFKTYDPTRTAFADLTYGWDEALVQPPLPPGVIGYPCATTLLVGDRVGPTYGVDLPFFDSRGSSQYLTHALHHAGFCEYELAWINAHDAEGRVNQLPRTNGQGVEFEQVLALGENAAAVCAAQALNFRTVSHPQYWKRFHHRDIDGYAAELRGKP